MLRENNVACGISTTGTGTLSLAASPASLGALDPFQAFSGLGLGTSLPCFMAYTLIEYADPTFSKIIQREKGNGLLLLGASITATTLARTVVRQTQVIATGANLRGSAQNVIAPITIGVAANCLVLIGPDVDDFVPALPGMNTLTSGPTSISQKDAVWFPAGLKGVATDVTFTMIGAPSGRIVAIHMLIDSVLNIGSLVFYVHGGTAGAGSLEAALYSLSPMSYLPDRKIVDFGSSSTVLTAVGQKTMTAVSPVIVTPGFYALCLLAVVTTAVPGFTAFQQTGPSCWGGNVGNSLPHFYVIKGGTGVAVLPNPFSPTINLSWSPTYDVNNYCPLIGFGMS